ncbi:MAG TPA: hypothetical protein VLN59_09085 [Burkholderiales bacterium]|nr:hypothetical protein [Burkholderiales bacterium]
MNRAVALLAALILAPGMACAADPLGRLFYTPAQRTQLDTARNHRTPTSVVESPIEAPPAPPALTYSGVVRRSDGKSTVWINNRVVGDGESLSGVAVLGRIRPDGGIRLNLLPDKGTVDLKVGQTLEVDSGSVAENYEREPVPSKALPSTSGTTEHETALSLMKRRRLSGARSDDAGAEAADRAMGRTADDARR